jgi:hypothetical protein
MTHRNYQKNLQELRDLRLLLKEARTTIVHLLAVKRQIVGDTTDRAFRLVGRIDEKIEPKKNRKV